VIAKTERYIAGSVTTEGTGRAVRDACLVYCAS
jgi:hypothetical protein